MDSEPLFYTPGSEPARCELCEVEGPWIGDHILSVHGVPLETYLFQFPESPVASGLLREKIDGLLRAERIPASESDLRVSFAGVEFPVYADVPESATLPFPSHYRVPSEGDLAKDVAAAAVALRAGRSLWVHGGSGSGKDAFFSAWSAITRRPGKLFSISPNADISSLMFVRSLSLPGGTGWEEGELLKILRDGYLTPSGRRIPYLVVLSDFDRASKGQAEYLRLILDSIQGRISGPGGRTYPVLPGTQIVATGNSSGDGDSSGRYVSAQALDSSLLDRFERFFEFHAIDPKDEGPILREKFPDLFAEFPGAIDSILAATGAVRTAIGLGELPMDFSHRSVCYWAGAAEDLLRYGNLPKTERANALVLGTRTILDRAPNPETRAALQRILDPHVSRLIPVPSGGGIPLGRRP